MLGTWDILDDFDSWHHSRQQEDGKEVGAVGQAIPLSERVPTSLY
jgi:hypothetical protein